MIDKITWRVDGKIKEIYQSDPSGSPKNTKFDYDAMGNRIAKHVYDSQTEMLEKSTYYILDAQGNTLSTYDHLIDNGTQTVNYGLSERQIYGSSRVGIFKEKVNLLDQMMPIDNTTKYTAGNKYYEMSNHLGNVLAVVSDIKMTMDYDTDGTVDGYLAKLASSADYSPFGVQLDGRTISSSEYRYGFQGQEKDDEMKGEGNSVNYKYRMHDARVGRFFAVDPLAKDYPWNSPYAFSENEVIQFVELEGLEKAIQPILRTRNGITTVVNSSEVGKADIPQNKKPAPNTDNLKPLAKELNLSVESVAKGGFRTFDGAVIDNEGKYHYKNPKTGKTFNGNQYRSVESVSEQAKTFKNVSRGTGLIGNYYDIMDLKSAYAEDGGLGKKSVITASGIAGEQIGGKIGLGIGASIGSAIPGAGTLIGGAIGNYLGTKIGGVVAETSAEMLMSNPYKAQIIKPDNWDLKRGQDNTRVGEGTGF